MCAQCGVLVAVIFEHNDRIYGAVNATSLDELALLGASLPASPQLLSPQEKIFRWLELWIPEVQVVITGA